MVLTPFSAFFGVGFKVLINTVAFAFSIIYFMVLSFDDPTALDQR